MPPGIIASGRFAHGIPTNAPVVCAAIAMWLSNGPVEDPVNCLSMLKRQVSGRADLGLPRLRVLYECGSEKLPGSGHSHPSVTGDAADPPNRGSVTAKRSDNTDQMILNMTDDRNKM